MKKKGKRTSSDRLLPTQCREERLELRRQVPGSVWPVPRGRHVPDTDGSYLSRVYSTGPGEVRGDGVVDVTFYCDCIQSYNCLDRYGTATM